MYNYPIMFYNVYFGLFLFTVQSIFSLDDIRLTKDPGYRSTSKGTGTEFLCNIPTSLAVYLETIVLAGRESKSRRSQSNEDIS